MEKGLSKSETIYKRPFIPIPTGCCHMILIYELIPPSAEGISSTMTKVEIAKDTHLQM
jgi:hypothetical protein